jgi:CheY-like chemotaxis protein
METFSHLKVLLVEDDGVTNFLSKIELNEFGLKNIHVTENGEEAIEYLKKEETPPDIILLDLNMPIMGGLEFLQKSYEMDLCTPSRIFILTSSIRPEDKIKIHEFDNVKDYLEKPLTSLKVENILKNF